MFTAVLSFEMLPPVIQFRVLLIAGDAIGGQQDPPTLTGPLDLLQECN